MSGPAASRHTDRDDCSAPATKAVAIRPDRRLALLALAKFAGLGAMIGVIVGIGMTLEGETKWSLIFTPLMLAAGGAATLGGVTALLWLAFPGQAIYIVSDGFLLGRRGPWIRKRIAVERVADIEFDEVIDGIDLAFTGWFGFTSPIPGLIVTLTATEDRWDVTNSAEVSYPASFSVVNANSERLASCAKPSTSRQRDGVTSTHPHRDEASPVLAQRACI